MPNPVTNCASLPVSLTEAAELKVPVLFQSPFKSILLAPVDNVLVITKSLSTQMSVVKVFVVPTFPPKVTS